MSGFFYVLIGQVVITLQAPSQFSLLMTAPSLKVSTSTAANVHEFSQVVCPGPGSL